MAFRLTRSLRAVLALGTPGAHRPYIIPVSRAQPSRLICSFFSARNCPEADDHSDPFLANINTRTARTRLALRTASDTYGPARRSGCVLRRGSGQPAPLSYCSRLRPAGYAVCPSHRSHTPAAPSAPRTARIHILRSGRRLTEVLRRARRGGPSLRRALRFGGRAAAFPCSPTGGGGVWHPLATLSAGAWERLGPPGGVSMVLSSLEPATSRHAGAGPAGVFDSLEVAGLSVGKFRV